MRLAAATVAAFTALRIDVTSGDPGLDLTQSATALRRHPHSATLPARLPTATADLFHAPRPSADSCPHIRPIGLLDPDQN